MESEGGSSPAPREEIDAASPSVVLPATPLLATGPRYVLIDSFATTKRFLLPCSKNEKDCVLQPRSDGSGGVDRTAPDLGDREDLFSIGCQVGSCQNSTSSLFVKIKI